MLGTVRRSVSVFGLCAIIASLCSGCAVSTGTPGRTAMNSVDLNYFQPDCHIKEQQIKFLQNLRSTADDQMASALSMSLTPWRAYTDPEAYNQQRDIASGRNSWLINHHLIYLKNYC